MSPLEIFLATLMTLLTVAPLVVAYRSKDQTWFWSPLTLFAAVFAYYFVIGPLLSLGLGRTSGYGMELRGVMAKAWLAGLLGLASIYAGFAIKMRPYRTKLVTELTPVLRKRLWVYFGILAGLGLSGFLYNAYVSGQSLGQILLPLHSGENLGGAEREGLAAGNYVFLLINTFIPALCILTTLQIKASPVRRLLLVGLPALLVVLFYTSLAFRHRIVILILSMAATAYLSRRQRPNPGVLIAGVAGIVLLSGLIVLTRTYGRGLDLTQIADLSLLEVFLGGFSESGTFFTTGLVIESYPATFAFIGLNPVWIALTIPIPRAFWPGKPYTVIVEQFSYLTGTGGQAVPVVGEHYMMAGWIGIVVGGLIIGVIYRGFWEFYRANPRNPLVVSFYAVAWALVFPVVNRGYLAQTLMEFFFDLLPLGILFLASRKLMIAIPAHGRQRASVSSAALHPGPAGDQLT